MDKIELVTKEELDSKFLSCLEKLEMPDYFLYIGKKGVKNWLDLDHSPDFSVSSRLTKLLQSNIQILARNFPKKLDVVSIGTGDGQKERLILKALVKKSIVRYFPVDISSQMVDEALESASDMEVSKRGIVAFFEDLPHLKKYFCPPVLLCMLGNNICNYDPDKLLSIIHEELEEGDYFLFDCHFFSDNPVNKPKWRKSFDRAYHSPLNVNFNISPLTERGLRPEDCSFNLNLIKVSTPFGSAYRTVKHIKILRETLILVRKSRVRLAAGDTIKMGFTYKFNSSQIEGYLKQYKFRMMEKFFSHNGENLLALAKKESM